MNTTTSRQDGQDRNTTGATPELSVRRILVPVDFSPHSLDALRDAVKLASRFGATLTLLHVVEPVANPELAYSPLSIEREKIEKLARRKLGVLARSASRAGCPIETKLVRTGKAYHEICEAARQLQADLIVISTHGYSGLLHVLLGSTAERVVRHAPCPVLTLRARPGTPA